MFADQRTRDLFEGRHRDDVPETVAKRAARQIDILLAAELLSDCKSAGRGRIVKYENADASVFRCQTEGDWWMTFEWQNEKAVNIRLEEAS